MLKNKMDCLLSYLTNEDPNTLKVSLYLRWGPGIILE